MKGLIELIIIAAPILIAGTVLFFWWRHRRSGFEARFARLIAGRSQAWVRELYIPDGMDGQIHVPHVIRTAAGFVVIDVIRVHGSVFGGDQIDEWAVIVNGHARKFRNPVATNRARVLAVRGLVPGIPVHGRVVLLGEVAFPKGRPDEVLTLDTLGAELADLPVAAPARGDWDEAWYGLAACANARQDAV